MATENGNISIRKYAEHLGISDKAVRNAITSGKLKKGVSYKMQMFKGTQVPVPEINVDVADEEWGHTHLTGKIKPGQNKIKVSEKADGILPIDEKNISTQPPAEEDELPADDEEIDEEELISRLKITSKTTYGEATRIREVIGSILDKIKVQEQKRILIRKDEVEKALFDAGTEIKKKLLNIPSRITSEIRGAETEVEAQKILTVEINQVLEQFASLAKID